MTLLQAHLLVVSAWLGLVGAESVLEQFGRDAASRRLIAGIHAWIDLLLEGPIVAGVLLTGGLLLARAWPAPPWLLVKLACGMVAIAANLVCMPLVLARWKSADDARVRVLARRVRLTGIAIPFAIAALVLGLVH